jgi:molecular chaperone HscB
MHGDLSQNYFELFGQPVSFQIDDELLARRYRELQRVAHPDRFANASDRDRRLAMQQASLINEAYQTLRSPLLRGRYLLLLAGVKFNDEHTTTQDTEFLLDQMELREALAMIKQAPEPLVNLKGVLNDITSRSEVLYAGLVNALETAQWNEAKTILNKLQFFERLKQECDDVESQLLDAV